MHQIRFTSAKLRARLELVRQLLYRRRLGLGPFEYHAGIVPLDDSLDTHEWHTLSAGSVWGKPRQEFTLRSRFTVPDGWSSNVALSLPLGTTASQDALKFLYGPEALLYIDGKAYQGVDRNHTLVSLDPAYCDSKPHALLLHGWMGIKDESYFIGEPALVELNSAVRCLIAQLRVGLGAIDALSEANPERARLLDLLDVAIRLLDLSEPFGAKFYASAVSALDYLSQHLPQAGRALDVSVAAVGHAHIDVAWLWPLSQTRRKAARTFSTALRLMDEDTDFLFSQSQAQLYAYIEQDHPDLFEKIQERVSSKRWEIIGGMWVEADCNLSGGEALVRQFLLGREYFRSKFTMQDSPVLWLPDVFGYAWQLPQLIRGAGLEYFVTAKLSWNQYNRIPYDAFWWQGLDGTRVLTQFITTTAPGWWGATYSAALTPAEIVGTWQGTQHKELSQALLIPFGHGDGGGGPTPEMLENRRLMADYPGLPQVHCATVGGFMQKLDSTSGSRLPTWNGELYFELHRGTYTTQAKNKRANRKSEFLLHDAEFLATWAHLVAGTAYPHAALKRAWQLLCLNQFHDIIPGSSIAEVYADSAQDYATIAAIGEQVRDRALEALCHVQPPRTRLAVFNPTSFERREIVVLPDDWERGTFPFDIGTGSSLPIQETTDSILCALPAVPAYGSRAFGATEQAPTIRPTGLRAFNLTVEVQEGHKPGAVWVLENDYLCCEFDIAGDLVRLYDKRAQREVLADGAKANQWQAFQDRPLDWEAWDIEIFYDDQCLLADAAHRVELIETGPLRACLEIERRVFDSIIRQRIYLVHDGTRLDFETTIDWRTQHFLLKIAFPLQIDSPHATYEIQWGNVERPTHRNTSWDWARFESCAHKWVDLSEGDYGVSLLNDCKYGHDIQNNVVRLTALRGPTFPDPQADMGLHHFTYSLLPHLGDWRSETAREAYALNDALILRCVKEPTAPFASNSSALVTLDSASAIIETIKLAEDDDGIIVRLYEYCRTRGPAALTTNFAIERAELVNLLEEPAGTLVTDDNTISLSFKPYQILSVNIVPSQRAAQANV